MSFLSDIFNPTLLMFLGITLLIVALLVVYFESKMREQNHKMASMLSLVSSLAEETNMMKFHLNHVNHVNMNSFQSQNIPVANNLVPFDLQDNKCLEETLIPVSDDDDENYDDEDDEDDEDDDDEDDEEDDDDDEDDDEDDENN